MQLLSIPVPAYYNNRCMHLSRPNLEGIFNNAHKYKYKANFLEVRLKIDIPYVYMHVYMYVYVPARVSTTDLKQTN